MTGPDQDDVVVALEALRSDARQWDGAASEIGAAAAAARGLVLEPGAFSFAGQEVAATYADIQRQLAGLLDSGQVAVSDIGRALRTSADVYEAEEQAGVHRLRGIW